MRSTLPRTSVTAVVLASLMLLSCFAAVWAGTSGTLRGKVLDEKKQPQSGVNIGIPAGTYRVIANRMDLAPFSADNVVITADFTTDLNLPMKTQAIQVEEVRINAERPLVQKDATGTTRFLSAEDA